MDDHSVIGVPVGGAILILAAALSHWHKKRALAALTPDERSLLAGYNCNFRSYVASAGIGLYAGALVIANHVTSHSWIIAGLTVGLGIAFVLAVRETVFKSLGTANAPSSLVRKVKQSYWLMAAGIIGYALGIGFEMIRNPFN